ncbi:MAG TPA: FAD-binding protein [Gemmatimonadaceae bacterium]|nr:FAD-binding protein [Gemmatimonadaceae bacterium]
MTTSEAPVLAHATAVAEEVQRARAERAPVRIVGAGRWLDAGRPVRAERTLDLRSLVSPDVVHYEPGDLTLTVRATATLRDIDRLVRPEGQWLPLDPAGGMDGTIGATIATASAGPLASAFGTPREQVLGVEVVTGLGEVIRAGGRVVKNVAGFDLTRLMTGAWGTLGAITEVSVRLRALPEAEATVAVPASAAAAWEWMNASEYTPYAAELLSPSVARALGIGDAGTLLVRVGGNESLVRATLESVATLGEVRRVEGDVWPRLSARDVAGRSVVRLSTRPSRLAPLWERVTTMLERVGGEAHATPTRGVIRCVIPADDGDEAFARLRGIIGALRVDANLLVERLPAPLWASFIPAATTDDLSRGIRAAFDPDHILNPGIFGELG